MDKKSETQLEAELKDLKVKHGTVYSVIVPLDPDKADDTATIFLKRSTRIITSAVRKVASQDAIKGVETALKSLYIGGDNLSIVTGNDYAVQSCESAVVEILSVQEATLKKN